MGDQIKSLSDAHWLHRVVLGEKRLKQHGYNSIQLIIFQPSNFRRLTGFLLMGTVTLITAFDYSKLVCIYSTFYLHFHTSLKSSLLHSCKQRQRILLIVLNLLLFVGILYIFWLSLLLYLTVSSSVILCCKKKQSLSNKMYKN